MKLTSNIEPKNVDVTTRAKSNKSSKRNGAILDKLGLEVR